ncbi:cohesin domain-containing protein [Candidatus Latescibacterota bacterium]
MKRVGSSGVKISGEKTSGVCLVLLIMCLIFLAGCSNPLDEKKEVFNLRLFPSTVVVMDGDETTVSVWIDEAVGLIATRFILSFDPSMVEVTAIETGGVDDIFVLAGATVVDIEKKYDNETGKVIIGLGAQKSGFTGASGSGSVVSINFKSKAVGKSNLSFVDVKPDDIVTTAYSSSSDVGWVEYQVQVFNAEINVVEKVDVGGTTPPAGAAQ